jgi:hypothetical protein
MPLETYPAVIVLDEDDEQLISSNSCRAADYASPPEPMVGLFTPQYDPCVNPRTDTRFCAEHRAEIGFMDDEDPSEDPREGDRYDDRGDR